MPITANGDFHLKEATLSFPSVIEPKSFQGGEARYSASFIMDKGSDEWKEFQGIINTKMTEAFADKAQGVMKGIMGDKRLRCFGNGSEKLNADGEIYAGYDADGAVYISASSKNQPQLFGADARPADGNANELFIGGNVVSAIVRVWIQNNKFGKAVRAELVGVQYLREGEHFGAGRTDAGAVFEPVPGSDTADAGDAFSMFD